MYKVSLPISKSIAQRILLLQAIHGDELMPVSAAMPDDVIVLRNALARLRIYIKGVTPKKKEPLTLDLKNNGTALRFLQVHLQRCYPGENIILDGDPRLKERDGKPTSQTTSALILHGQDIPFDENESPYITMSRRVAEMYRPDMHDAIEADWSAAAFWYEFMAVHAHKNNASNDLKLLLIGLKDNSLQGDRMVADIYEKHFGVHTTFTSEGAILTAQRSNCETLQMDFTNCPDLYPAIALTCERLGIELIANGTERLRFKESDRIEAVQRHEVRNDHRMAMALMAADFPVTTEEQKCIEKSYPEFANQYNTISTQLRQPTDGHPTAEAEAAGTLITHITPQRGVNDDGLGKKHALAKLIREAQSDFVWLHDDDIVWPKAATNSQFSTLNSQLSLVILPLRMESENAKPSLLERLQIAEYAAIQELTMQTAKRGKAVMCSGANLIVRRETWLECEPDIHPEIPSGDDMFLLEAVKRHHLNITVIDEPEYTAVVRPITSWKAFLRQRMRWAGKAPHYTDKDIRRCGMLIAAANILQILCPLVILIKFPVEYSLIRKRCIAPDSSSFSLFMTALLLELVYPFYLLVALLGGLLRQKKW